MNTLPKDTAELLGVELEGVNFRHCDSRSLMLERYANPRLKENSRRDFFTNALARQPNRKKLETWQGFLIEGLMLTAADIVFGELQGRLILNGSGGVMENAGLSLDRFSGIPYIPGSAVKGCARRAALQQLSEQAESASKAKLLVTVARVFGWGDTEWKDDRNSKGELHSDFELACGEGEAWKDVRELVADQIVQLLRLQTNPDKPIWKQLGSYGGDVCFLPAYPWELPAKGDLELDVITCHHQVYYSNSDAEFAADTEEPIPVVFPTVAPGLIFAFAVIGTNAELADAARKWLQQSLSAFGLGGKTSSGYGWFETSKEFQDNQRVTIRQKLEAEAQRLRKEQEEQTLKRKAEADRQAAAEHKRQVEALPLDQQEDLKLAQLKDDQFRSKVEKFADLPEPEKLAVYRALRGLRVEFWRFMRERNDKGKRPWCIIVPQLFALAKSRKEKMP